MGKEGGYSPSGTKKYCGHLISYDEESLSIRDKVKNSEYIRSSNGFMTSYVVVVL